MFSSVYNTERPPVKSLLQEMQGVNGVAPLPNPADQISTDTIQPKTVSAVAPSSPLNASQLMSKYANYAAAGANAVSALIPKKNEFINDGYTDKAALRDNMRDQAMGSIKDSIAPSFGPLGMAINSASKIGDAIGDGIGGDTGAVVSSVFAPDQAILSTWNDPDLSAKDKIIGTALPFYGALKGRKAKQRRQEEFLKNKRIGERIVSDRRLEADLRMEAGLQQAEDLATVKRAQLGIMSKY